VLERRLAQVVHQLGRRFDQRLHGIMKAIHEQCVEYGTEGKFINYVNGANIAGFIKVADSMIDQGVV